MKQTAAPTSIAGRCHLLATFCTVPGITPATTGKAVSAPPVRNSCIIAQPVIAAKLTASGSHPISITICVKGNTIGADAALDCVTVPAIKDIMKATGLNKNQITMLM